MVDIEEKSPSDTCLCKQFLDFKFYKLRKDRNQNLDQKKGTKRHLKVAKQQIQRTYLKIYQRNSKNLTQKTRQI